MHCWIQLVGWYSFQEKWNRVFLKPFSFGFSSHSEIETFPKDKGPLVEPGIPPSLLPERMLDAAFFQLRSFGASKFSVMEMSSIHPYIILIRKLFCFVNPLRPPPRHRATFLSDTKLWFFGNPMSRQMIGFKDFLLSKFSMHEGTKKYPQSGACLSQWILQNDLKWFSVVRYCVLTCDFSWHGLCAVVQVCCFHPFSFRDISDPSRCTRRKKKSIPCQVAMFAACVFFSGLIPLKILQIQDKHWPRPQVSWKMFTSKVFCLQRCAVKLHSFFQPRHTHAPCLQHCRPKP